jgi:uncharacterized protein YjaG (DUF416 family)
MSTPHRFDMELLEQRLFVLSKMHCLAFAATCAERLLPNYSAFQRASQWGSVEVLRSSLDSVWRLLSGESVSEEVVLEQISKCDSVLPDTEEFDSPLTSSALDAGSAVVETLKIVIDGSPRRAAVVASFCTDTIDMFIQQRDELDPGDTDLDWRIARDPLMVQELANQEGVLSVLERIRTLDPLLIDTLRLQARNEGVSNIDMRS